MPVDPRRPDGSHRAGADMRLSGPAGRALNILGKWRTHYAAWQFGMSRGTISKHGGDPEVAAVKDMIEKVIFLRAEMSALVGLLVAKGAVTAEEWNEAVRAEAVQLSKDYSRQWQGARAGEDGMHYDVAAVRAAGWMDDWRP